MVVSSGRAELSTRAGSLCFWMWVVMVISRELQPGAPCCLNPAQWWWFVTSNLWRSGQGLPWHHELLETPVHKVEVVLMLWVVLQECIAGWVGIELCLGTDFS